jgi:hypothetical protein
MGPLAAFAKSVPKSAAEIGEALQNEAVKGLQDFNDQLVDAIMNAKSLKDVFHSVAASILADLLKIAMQQAEMALFRTLMGAFGGGLGGGIPAPDLGADMGVSLASSSVVPAAADFSFLPGFANGGTIMVGGMGGIDRNVLSLNGLPIARVSYGEPINIGNDNQPSFGPSFSLTMHNDFSGVDPSSVARVEAKLDQLKDTLPATIVGTMKDAQSRFIWRG